MDETNNNDLLRTGKCKCRPKCICNFVIFAARCYASAALAVMRCPSVCVSVTFVHSVQTINCIYKNFSPSGSQAIIVFLYQTAWHWWQYSDGNPHNGDVECRWGRHTEIAILSLYMASLRAVNAATGQVLSIRRRQTNVSHVVALIAGSKRRRW